MFVPLCAATVVMPDHSQVTAVHVLDQVSGQLAGGMKVNFFINTDNAFEKG